MDSAHRLYDALGVLPAETISRNGLTLPRHFGSVGEEYRRAVSQAAVYHRADRGLIEIAGKDRLAWLHNLTTTEVRNLRPGDGNYAFALDTKGRILFDLNILVFDRFLWADIDSRYRELAVEHFGHYLITEEAQLADCSVDFDRWALIGPGIAELGGRLGAANLSAMPQLQNVRAALAGSATVIRHDFAGPPSVELFIPRDSADMETFTEICRLCQVLPIGAEAVETLRIEAGIPALGRDIDNTVLPAETLQVERGVSFQKGCYLGQEVVERMRSRGALARRLTGLVFAGDRPPPPGAVLYVGEAQAGTLTSSCVSLALGKPIALGYLKTAFADFAGEIVARAGADEFAGRVHALPFVRFGSRS